MLLVIPSIRIDHAFCSDKIAALSADYHDPASRARLLRKENAKALHIIIEDEDVWCEDSLCILRELRKAVDIPTEVSLEHIPSSMDDIKQLIEIGVYRVFLSPTTPHEKIRETVAVLGTSKTVPTLVHFDEADTLFGLCKELKLNRVAVHHEDSASVVTDWEQMTSLAQKTKLQGIRLTSLFSVYSYSELMMLDSLSPVFDSVVLGSALAGNAFPCQGLWREAEEQALSSEGFDSNLWRNPLEGVPHI
jgi:hypothetical protein